MIDHRLLTFDASAIDGITLVRDRYLGLGIISVVENGHVIASLEPQSLFEVSFFRENEGPGPRFYIPNCELRFDLDAIGNHQQDPPLGSLIVAKSGVSLMVKPPRSPPSPFRLTGDLISQPHREIFFTRWRL